MNRSRRLPRYPRMFLDLGHRNTLLGVHLEHPPNEILGVGGKFRRHCEFTYFDLGEQIPDIVIVEW